MGTIAAQVQEIQPSEPAQEGDWHLGMLIGHDVRPIQFQQSLAHRTGQGRRFFRCGPGPGHGLSLFSVFRGHHVGIADSSASMCLLGRQPNATHLHSGFRAR